MSSRTAILEAQFRDEPVTKIEKNGLLYQLAADLPDQVEAADELVERLLTRNAVSVLYGASNSGKTFLTIDLACAIARGIDWQGRRTDGGMVIYLAVEGPRSVRTRIQAYQRTHGVIVPRFVIVTSPVNLFDGTHDTEAVIHLIREVESRLGEKAALIIGDTLSRLVAGANENNGQDMGAVVQHVDRIVKASGAHFLLIHHSGKDAAKGARGWSGLQAAIDTEIEISSNAATGEHIAEITKQRDLSGKNELIGFRLRVVELGVNKWDKPITSCVVDPIDAPQKVTNKRPSEIAGAIAEFFTQRKSGIRKGELVLHFEGRYTSSAVYRELKKMASDGRVHEVAGIIALVKL